MNEGRITLKPNHFMRLLDQHQNQILTNSTIFRQSPEGDFVNSNFFQLQGINLETQDVENVNLRKFPSPFISTSSIKLTLNLNADVENHQGQGFELNLGPENQKAASILKISAKFPNGAEISLTQNGQTRLFQHKKLICSGKISESHFEGAGDGEKFLLNGHLLTHVIENPNQKEGKFSTMHDLKNAINAIPSFEAQIVNDEQICIYHPGKINFGSFHEHAKAEKEKIREQAQKEVSKLQKKLAEQGVATKSAEQNLADADQKLQKAESEMMHAKKNEANWAKDKKGKMHSHEMKEIIFKRSQKECEEAEAKLKILEDEYKALKESTSKSENELKNKKSNLESAQSHFLSKVTIMAATKRLKIAKSEKERFKGILDKARKENSDLLNELSKNKNLAQDDQIPENEDFNFKALGFSEDSDSQVENSFSTMEELVNLINQTKEFAANIVNLNKKNQVINVKSKDVFEPIILKIAHSPEELISDEFSRIPKSDFAHHIVKIPVILENAHLVDLEMKFVKIRENAWALYVKIPEDFNQINQEVSLLSFNEDGSFQKMEGPASSGLKIHENQTVKLDFENVSQFAFDFLLQEVEMVGKAKGKLVEHQISTNGVITAKFSNGLEKQAFKVEILKFDELAICLEKAQIEESEFTGDDQFFVQDDICRPDVICENCVLIGSDAELD